MTLLELLYGVYNCIFQEVPGNSKSVMTLLELLRGTPWGDGTERKNPRSGYMLVLLTIFDMFLFTCFDVLDMTLIISKGGAGGAPPHL